MSTDKETTTNPLSLTFLGAPEVHYQGQPLKFRSRKVLALLLYLVVEDGIQRRDKLMTLLWPESAPKQASATLRSSLARIKKTLSLAGEWYDE